MTKRERAKPAYAWAAVGKRTNKILTWDGHYSIWKSQNEAERDCPAAYGRIARVRITEVK